ncbi:hypothetical protein SLA2020_199250 [Shorea laevis]
MAIDSNWKAWISDRLISLLGYYQPVIAQYIVALAKQARSAADVLVKLEECGFPSSDETRTFAEEICFRFSCTASASENLQEIEAVMLARRQRNYPIIDADDDEDNGARAGAEIDSVTGKGGSRHKRGFRKKVESGEDDQDDEMILKVEEKGRVKRRKISCDEDDGSESEEERERLRDQREKEELERHIREKYKAGTRKLMEPKLTRKEKEEAIWRSNAQEQNDIGSLREASRREYLKKRMQMKLEELRDGIEDEQYLFHGVKLTEAESREQRYKREMYELLKKGSEEDENSNLYRMPETYDQQGVVDQEKRFAVALKHVWEPNVGRKVDSFAEQEAWEEHQID